jgi:uncharacterized protein (TIGR02118 family)
MREARMIVTVIYPKTETSHFDLTYYLTSHMPLVDSLWRHHGLASARVLQGTGSLGGAPAFELICMLEFPSREAFLGAAGAHADEIMGDIPRFTNVQPIIQFNDVVAG